MKYLVNLGMAVCLGMASATAGANMASNSTATTLLKQSSKNSSSSNPVSLLFVQQADQATLTSIGNRCFDVMLSGLKPSLLYFSDQPQ